MGDRSCIGKGYNQIILRRQIPEKIMPLPVRVLIRMCVSAFP